METKESVGRRFAAGLALAAAALIAYLPALRAGFIWDDDTFLTNNPLIRASDGLWRFWFTAQPADYWPVTSTSLWLEWRLWGMHAAGYHATNLLLHIACCLLLWAVLRRLRLPGAWLAALLFAVHPVNVESVAWIAERKNLLAMLFYLASIGWYLGSETPSSAPISRRPKGEGGPPPVSRSGAPIAYWLSVSAFVLAMLSKGSVATLPLVLLGIVLWRRKPDRRDAARLAPFFLAAAVLALVNVWFQQRRLTEILRHATPLERLLGAGGVVWFYLGKALVPLNLVFVYPSLTFHGGDPRSWGPLLAAAAFAAFLWQAAWRRPAGARGRLFAWGYFCAALVPVMGFTDVYFMKYSLVADRYEHVALLGVAAFGACAWERAAAGLAEAGRRSRRARLQFLPFAPPAVVVALLCLTWRRCLAFHDPETLFAATLKANPGAWMANNDLGAALAARGRIDEAKAHFEASLRTNPGNAEAHCDLGLALATEGAWREAIAQYEEALRIKPDFAEAQNDLGSALLATPGRLPEAVAHYQEAVLLNPESAKYQFNLALALQKLPEAPTADAAAHYEEALRIDPDFADAHNSLANILASTPGRLSEAIAHYEAAVRLQPGSAMFHYNLGLALARTPGDRRQAIGEFEAVLRIEPGSVTARRLLDRLRAGPGP